MSRPPTLVDVAVANLAPRYGKLRSLPKAAQAITVAVSLAIAADNEGDWTQVHYAEYWKRTDRSAQRDWALFREAFPHEQSPERIARWLRLEYGRALEERSSIALSAPADALLAV